MLETGAYIEVYNVNESVYLLAWCLLNMIFKSFYEIKTFQELGRVSSSEFLVVFLCSAVYYGIWYWLTWILGAGSALEGRSMFFPDSGEGKFSITADVCGVESLIVCCLSCIY